MNPMGARLISNFLKLSTADLSAEFMMSTEFMINTDLLMGVGLVMSMDLVMSAECVMSVCRPYVCLSDIHITLCISSYTVTTCPCRV